jgi:hypothetical protein
LNTSFYKLAYKLTYTRNGVFQRKNGQIMKGEPDEDKFPVESAKHQDQGTEAKTICLSLRRTCGKDRTEKERTGGVGTDQPSEVVPEQTAPEEKCR